MQVRTLYRILLSLAAVLTILAGLGIEKASAQSEAAGVLIRPDGVLQSQMYGDPGGTLFRQRLNAAKASLPANVKAFSKLRWISLTRLEKILKERQASATDEMRYLAGLLRVRYVFCYPQSGDIVIGGPAEGWMTDVAGRVVGITTGRPMVQLQDLVVALRAFPPGASGKDKFIGCSIDPTKEGLASMQQMLRQLGSRATPADTQYIITALKTSLGMHNVRIDGVSPKTNFARVMVEADYRMKLIGIGLERPPVRMVSFVQVMTPAAVSRNALLRWFFLPDYQCVRATDDRLGMELVGDGVKLVGEDELVSASGQRAAAGSSNKASLVFTTSFTKHYPELAERSPVYAELRNVIDLAVAAAYIQEQDFYGKAGWKMPVFGNEEAFPVESQTAPTQVESAVTAVWKGNHLTTPIAGGVHLQPRMALSDENRLADENGKVSQVREGVKLDLPPDRWWWE